MGMAQPPIGAEYSGAHRLDPVKGIFVPYVGQQMRQLEQKRADHGNRVVCCSSIAERFTGALARPNSRGRHPMLNSIPLGQNPSSQIDPYIDETTLGNKYSLYAGETGERIAANWIEGGENSVGFFRGLNHLRWNRANEEQEMSSSPSPGDGLTYQGKL
jgi:hypothetical protein